jgi:hypothetical protein
MRRRFVSVFACLAVCSAALAQPAPAQHVLAPRWRVLWTEDGRSSAMTIKDAASQGGVTKFEGALLEGAENCPIAGRIVDSSHLSYVEGIETTHFIIYTFVTILATCSDHSLTLELLGLPLGGITLSGRAIRISRDGPPVVAPIALAPES